MDEKGGQKKQTISWMYETKHLYLILKKKSERKYLLLYVYFLELLPYVYQNLNNYVQKD